jgi:hypothetical protein
MRQAGEQWLPQEPREQHDAYTKRLDRSILYNGYESAISRIVSRPFSRPVTVEDMPEKYQDFEDNVDSMGTDLTQFSRNMFDDGVDHGVSHILVDMPKLNGTAEAENNALPVFIHVKAPQLIGWNKEGTTLKEVRIYEQHTREKQKWDEEIVEMVRVYRPEDWELWAKGEDDDEYSMIDQGVNPLGYVPLVSFYTKRTGFLMAKPPLMDIAWLNLAHWQSASDQRNILRFARVGILFAAGFREEEIESITIGPSSLLRSTNPEAKLAYVEHSGRAIQAGAADLVRLEEQMEVLGMQPFIARTANSTATGKAIDEQRTATDTQAWIRSLENTLMQAFEMASDWTNTTLPPEFSVNIFSDFSLPFGDRDVDSLIKMRQTVPPLITSETFLKEVKRRGILSEIVDPELEAVEAAGQDAFDEPDAL